MIYRKCGRILLWCLIPMLFMGQSQAREVFTMHPHQADENDFQEPQLQAISIELPDFPEAQNFVEVELDLPRSRFTYLVDKTSIRSNTDHGVIDYTLKVVADSGSESIVRESMHCSKREYRTLAYGDSEGNWRRLKRLRWMQIQPSRMNPYHEQLWLNYFCRGLSSVQLSTAEIVDYLTSPDDSSRQGYR